MAVSNVQQVQDRLQTRDLTRLEEHKRRVQLYSTSQFEPGRQTVLGIGKTDLSALSSNTKDQRQSQRQSREVEEARPVVKMADGSTVELPGLSAEQREQLDQIYARSGEHREALEASSFEVGASAFDEVRDNPGSLDGSAPLLTSSVSAGMETIENYMISAGEQAHEDETSDLLLLGLAGIEQNLGSIFQKAQAEEGLSGEIRTDIAEIESVLVDWPDDGSTESFDYREVRFDENGVAEIIEHQDVEMTKAEAITLVNQLERQTDTLGSINNQTLIFLQYMVNKYQQAETAVSNIMRITHDTHRTLAGNFRA